MRFSASNKRLPASTTVMERPGFSSESFWARKTAEMPPPMMQMSLSKRGTVGPHPVGFKSRRLDSRIAQRAALVAADGRIVRQIVGFRTVEVETHQIDRDV